MVKRAARRENRKHEKNIYCTVCGKDYSDPIAAKKVRIGYCLLSRRAVSEDLIPRSTSGNTLRLINPSCSLYPSPLEMWESNRWRIQTQALAISASPTLRRHHDLYRPTWPYMHAPMLQIPLSESLRWPPLLKYISQDNRTLYRRFDLDLPDRPTLRADSRFAARRDTILPFVPREDEI